MANTDDRLKELMQELGIAIIDTLGEAPKIQEAIERIRAAGYDVFLVMEATIGFNKRPETVPENSGDLRKLVTPQDENFLKGLHIGLGEKPEA
jgi:hypothetical protein